MPCRINSGLLGLRFEGIGEREEDFYVEKNLGGHRVFAGRQRGRTDDASIGGFGAGCLGIYGA